MPSSMADGSPHVKGNIAHLTALTFLCNTTDGGKGASPGLDWDSGDDS